MDKQEIKQLIHVEIWGATNLPNLLSINEMDLLEDQLTNLTQRVVDATTEGIFDRMSYTKEGRRLMTEDFNLGDI